MAVKRSKTSKSKSTADAYEQAMLAEGAPLALDLLALGPTIADLIAGKPRKAAKKKRAKKKARSKVSASRTKRTKNAKKSIRRKSRRRA